MQLAELVDRYEILYPENDKLSDLRRAMVDQDFSSIFRLGDPVDEMRKAVMEKNIHSIFRVLQDRTFYDVDDYYEYVECCRKAIVNENIREVLRLLKQEDLRKLIVEGVDWKFWPILDTIQKTQFTPAFKKLYTTPIEFDHDCFSRGQLISKQWLVQELEKLDVDLGTVFLCAGWYATLATMLFESSVSVERIRSFDRDPACTPIAEIFNKPWHSDNWRFQSVCADIHKINYRMHSYTILNSKGKRVDQSSSPDTIINTSCEHIENFTDWYSRMPENKLIVLQSNNYTQIEEHVNCVTNSEQFAELAPMQQVLFEGELELEKYTRYMRIGYR